MAGNEAITFEGVSFRYDGGPVLQDVDLHLERGEYLAMLGPNGGGKTTFLKLVLGLLAPTGGRVRVLGRDPRDAVPRVGYLQQYAHEVQTFPITVLDVVLLGRLGRSDRRWGFGRRDRAEAEKALDRVGMLEHAGRRIGELSGGQKQRVFIARAIVSEPDLLLLDEPLSSIDQESKHNLFEFLKRLHERMTIVMVSHDLSVISRDVTSVACVGGTLHHHKAPELTWDMVKMLYGCEDGDCPVELIAHGVPHRVLEAHEGMMGHAHEHEVSRRAPGTTGGEGED
jgi:zinc transport system ATP-binding protein